MSELFSESKWIHLKLKLKVNSLLVVFMKKHQVVPVSPVVTDASSDERISFGTVGSQFFMNYQEFSNTSTLLSKRTFLI